MCLIKKIFSVIIKTNPGHILAGRHVTLSRHDANNNEKEKVSVKSPHLRSPESKGRFDDVTRLDERRDLESNLAVIYLCEIPGRRAEQRGRVHYKTDVGESMSTSASHARFCLQRRIGDHSPPPPFPAPEGPKLLFLNPFLLQLQAPGIHLPSYFLCSCALPSLPFDSSGCHAPHPAAAPVPPTHPHFVTRFLFLFIYLSLFNLLSFVFFA